MKKIICAAVLAFAMMMGGQVMMANSAEAADVWAAQNKSPDGSEIWEYYVVSETCAKQSTTQYSGTYKVVYPSGRADVLPAIFYRKNNDWYEVRAGWGEKCIRKGSAIEKVLEVIKEYAE